jgi:hypothetical protein
MNETQRISQNAKASSSLCPVGPALARKTRNVASDQPLKTLHDPGTNETFVDRRILPKGANGKTVNPPPIKALNGVDIISQKSILEGLTLPEFSATQRMDKRAQAHVSDQPNGPCDLVLRLDLSALLGIDIWCLTRTITWLDQTVPWKPKSCFDNFHLADSVSYETRCSFVDTNDDFNEWMESRLTLVNVKSSKHEKVDADCAAKQRTHSTPLQQADLAEALKDFRNLFRDKFGCHPGCQVHLEPSADAKPFHARPRPVDECNKAVFKEESERLF